MAAPSPTTVNPPPVSLATPIAGYWDDGTLEGALRAKIVKGELVRMPWRFGQYNAFTDAGSIGANPATGLSDNCDGSASGFLFTLGIGIAHNFFCQFKVYGTVVGIRYWPGQNSANARDFSVSIDGVNYRVPVTTAVLQVDTQTAYLNSDGEASYIVADDLPDTAHDVRIFVPGDPVIGTQEKLFGYIAERRAGYENPKNPIVFMTATGQLSNALQSIGVLAGLGDASKTGVEKVIFFNTDASAHTVTVSNGATTIDQLVLTATGTAGARVEWPSGGAFSGLFHGDQTAAPKFMADAAAKVQYQIFHRARG